MNNFFLSAVAALSLLALNAQCAVCGDLNSQLIEAARNGDKKAVIVLINKGAEVHQREKTYNYTALMAAASSGNEDIFLLLLNRGDDLYSEKDYSLRVMESAIYGGNPDIIRYINSKGVNVNNKSWSSGFTYLAEAANLGRTDAVKALVELGANINNREPYGATALSLASKQGHTDIIQFLMEKGATIESAGESLLRAAEYGNIDAVKLLVDYKANVNAQDNWGRTPLISALRAPEEKSLELIKFLTEHGADIDVKTKDDRTALMLAAREGQEKHVKLLLDNGANIHIKDIRNMTAIDYTYEEVRVDIARLIASHKQPDDKPENLTDVLIEAIRNNKLDVLNSMIQQGMDVNKKDGLLGMTPLMFAAHFGSEYGIVSALLENGAKVNLIDDTFGMTALMFAANKDHLYISKLLVEHGALINAQDARYGRTAMMFSATTSEAHVMKYLESVGADVDIKNHKGRTAKNYYSRYHRPPPIE